MAGIKIGIERELESDFKEFAQALGLADLRSEPSSAAGGLELVHITIVDLHGLHLSAQYAWGALLGWAMARSKFFELFHKGSRIQPSKNELPQLEKLVKPPTKRLLSSQGKKKAPKSKSAVHTGRRKKSRR